MCVAAIALINDLWKRGGQMGRLAITQDPFVTEPETTTRT